MSIIKDGEWLYRWVDCIKKKITKGTFEEEEEKKNRNGNE